MLSGSNEFLEVRVVMNCSNLVGKLLGKLRECWQVQLLSNVLEIVYVMGIYIYI